MQNNLVELMSLLVFVMPEMFANKKEQLKKMFSMFPVNLFLFFSIKKVNTNKIFNIIIIQTYNEAQKVKFSNYSRSAIKEKMTSAHGMRKTGLLTPNGS